MNYLDYFYCILFIIAGIYFLITDWKKTIYAGIVKHEAVGGFFINKKIAKNPLEAFEKDSSFIKILLKTINNNRHLITRMPKPKNG